MELAPPPLDSAQPGKPITAQAWNAIKDAILVLYDTLNGLDQGSVIVVEIKASGTPFTEAVVVARQGELRVRAVPPLGNQTTYVLSGLTEGEWVVSAVAEGYLTKETTIEVPGEGTLGITLERNEMVIMPDLFGEEAKNALVALDAQKIELDQVFDTTGEEVTRTDILKGRVDNVVLYQQPAAGSYLSVKTDRARLVLGAAVASTTVVTVPDLQGMTFEAAEKALAERGLSIESVAFLEKES